MPSDELVALIDQAKKVLEANWLGRSTKPSPHLYPHQWNWDSGFIAIGYARYDQLRAQTELSTLFDAQWSNGMVPQIVFNETALGGYFPEPDFWQCERSPHAPADPPTSGITMPPVHGIAAAHIVRHATDRDMALGWLREIFPRIVRLHEYLYRDRDPMREALVSLRHPWESGLDNAPTWAPPLERIAIDKRTLPHYVRRDLKKGIPASHRPTDDDYDRYVYLVDLFRRLSYDEASIFAECPFVVQDPLFNTILARANQALVELGGSIGADVGQLREWASATNAALRDKLWHEDHGAFDVYDVRAGERVGTRTASGFMPLLSGAPTAAQAARMYQELETNSFCPMHDASCFSVPNYDLAGDYFDQVNYWRGPVWINMNWLLMHGLRRYGFVAKADAVRADLVELVRRWGFHEYFDPYRNAGVGYGTDGFSWTAALFIDAVLDEND